MRRFILLLVIISFMLLSTTNAWAKEPATPNLTFQQAVEKAKANNKTLQSRQYDIDRSKEVRDYAETKMLFAPTAPTTTVAERAFTSYVQADLSWQMAKRNYKAQEDMLVMQTYQAYDGLLQALEKVKVAEVQLKSADWKHRMAVISYKTGVLDKMGVTQAESALAKAKSDYQSSQKSLEDAYQKFNQLVGLWPEDRPVLVDKPVFEKIKIDNLDVEVERAIESSPTIWLSQQKINLAKLNLDLYDLTNINNTEPYEAKKFDVDKAEVSAVDYKEQTRILVRSIYYKVVQLEEQYSSAQEKVKLAEEALRVARIKYDLGMATRSDLYTAESDLALALQSLLDISSQHEILKFAFRKPWAYAISAGSSTSTDSGSSNSTS